MRHGHRIIGIIGMGALAIVVFSLLTMLLWNALMPAIFGVATIGFLQAIGILVLFRLLFGGIGRGFQFKEHKKHLKEKQKLFKEAHRDHADFHNRMNNMSREERREFVMNWFQRGREEHPHPSASRQGPFENGDLTAENARLNAELQELRREMERMKDESDSEDGNKGDRA